MANGATANVIVTGLPGNVKLPRLIFVFQSVLKTHKFWIRELSDIPGTEHKQMTMEFKSSYKARTARKFLDQFIFRSGNLMFPLRARMNDDFRSSRKRYRSPSSYAYRERSPHGYRDNSPHGYRDRSLHSYRDRSSDWDRRNKHSRERSHSPLYNESSQLDLEIELLRKQRMVIEEERRLLLERKKLELIRDCGSGPSNELDFLQEHDRRYSRERPMPNYNKRPRSPGPKVYKKSLPSFIMPCKKILNGMQHLIEQYEENGQRKILVKLIRSTLRRRLAIALENKPHMYAKEVVALYRKYYPTTTDESLITKLMANITESYLPSKTNDDGKPKQQKNQADGKGNASAQDNDAGTSDSDDIKADKVGNTKKNPGQDAIDKNIEIMKEWDLSLDASDIQSSLKNVDIDWAEGEDWSEVAEDDEQLLKSD